MEIKTLITEFCKTRPEAEVIIGYGSGVKKQANDKGFDKQIDLIMGVKDSTKWHQENYQENPKDYSKLGYLLLPLYKNLGTKINYLSYLPFKDNMFKIGVVQTNDLIDDLFCWDNFYLAGRCQKSVDVIKSTQLLDQAIIHNRLNALKIALLLSEKKEISKIELYELLCSLSFIGDWRKILHVENANKVKNIVNGSLEELENIYNPLNKNYYSQIDNDLISINFERILNETMTLPIPIENKLDMQTINSHHISQEELKKIREIILTYLTKVNIKASAAQPFKGLLINGVSKTKTYLMQKLEKK